MSTTLLVASSLVALLLTPGLTVAQTDTGAQLAELVGLKSRVGSGDTRTRVGAMHRVWSIALAATASEVKLTALELLEEPVGSSSDHIRMPAVYAIAEIAASTDDAKVKLRALSALREPMDSGQVPIRDVAIDAVNAITRTAGTADVALAAVRALTPALRSGNNGVRIPAINALTVAVSGSLDESAYQAALDLLVEPLESSAAIGGLEVRMMAIVAVERLGVAARNVTTQARAMGLLQSYVARSGWEPEAKGRAQQAVSRIQAGMKQ